MAKPESHFPANYRMARRAFLETSEAAGLAVTSRLHADAVGAEGETLFLDTAVVGPRDVRSALLLISGTHGVEGYFGSGVQAGLLREGRAKRPLKKSQIVL